MEASRLVLSPETLRFKPMTSANRSQLRRENIKALIRSKPAGTPIKMSQFMAVTNHKSDGVIHSMLLTMIRRGEISRIHAENAGKSYSWTVNEDYDPNKKPAPVQQSTMTIQNQHGASNVFIPSDPQYIGKLSLDVSAVREAAKTFIWEKDSDSLRDFIADLEAKEKDRG